MRVLRFWRSKKTFFIFSLFSTCRSSTHRSIWPIVSASIFISSNSTRRRRCYPSSHSTRALTSTSPIPSSICSFTSTITPINRRQTSPIISPAFSTYFHLENPSTTSSGPVFTKICTPPPSVLSSTSSSTINSPTSTPSLFNSLQFSPNSLHFSRISPPSSSSGSTLGSKVKKTSKSNTISLKSSKNRSSIPILLSKSKHLRTVCSLFNLEMFLKQSTSIWTWFSCKFLFFSSQLSKFHHQNFEIRIFIKSNSRFNWIFMKTRRN